MRTQVSYDINRFRVPLFIKLASSAAVYMCSHLSKGCQNHLKTTENRTYLLTKCVRIMFVSHENSYATVYDYTIKRGHRKTSH